MKITFPELSEILADTGAEEDMTVPVDAVIRSQGVVFDDHSFRLADKGELGEHRLFDPTQPSIDILAPTRCRPDGVSRPAEEIRSSQQTAGELEFQSGRKTGDVGFTRGARRSNLQALPRRKLYLHGRGLEHVPAPAADRASERAGGRGPWALRVKPP